MQKERPRRRSGRSSGGGGSVPACGALGLDGELHLPHGAVDAAALPADEVVRLALPEHELEAGAGALHDAGHQLGRLEVARLVVRRVPHHVHAVRVHRRVRRVVHEHCGDRSEM